jgi:hypothetical protein
LAVEPDQVDKIMIDTRVYRYWGVCSRVSSVQCPVSLLFLALLFAGCATISQKPVASTKPVETTAEQIDAAQKIVGAMGNKEVSRQDLKALAVDMQKNEDSRSAVQKIIGVTNEKPVIKYSPVTGKHYSGDLEYDPETGAKLEVIEE